jgi:hypothetical protein
MKDVVYEGGLCVRYLRGSATRLSTHAFGTALDMSFAGQRLGTIGSSAADIERQEKTARYFERAGWIWGGDGIRRIIPTFR